MGHIVTSPLPRFANLAEARSHAAGLFAEDAVPGTQVFVELPWGPVAVDAAGTCWGAEYIGRSGLTWVVPVV